jgi:hypothetical protein
MRTHENTYLLQAKVNRQHLLRLLTPRAVSRGNRKEIDNRYEERSPNRSLCLHQLPTRTLWWS